ncbi:MAG: protein translocase subunit SecF [Patescibacteria group bacterium]
MAIIKYRKLFYIFSGLVVAASATFLFIFGLKPGIDFTGGTIMEVEFTNALADTGQIKNNLAALGFPEARLQPSSEKGLIIRLRSISEDEHRLILKTLAGDAAVPGEALQEKRFDSIGPTIGLELKRKAFIAVGMVLFLILIFVTWSFRNVSVSAGFGGAGAQKVSGWKYALAAVLALIHDVIVPVGLFSLLGRFGGVETDSLFITACLTILGFSVHDTIVVFDRIRENLRKSGWDADFETIVGRSLNETYGRSLATSFAIFLVLGFLFWFGGDSTRFFALTLLVGLVAGTYSSICLASPFLVSWSVRPAKK